MSEPRVKSARSRLRAYLELWPVAVLIAGLLLSLIWTVGIAYGAFELLLWHFGH